MQKQMSAQMLRTLPRMLARSGSLTDPNVEGKTGLTVNQFLFVIMATHTGPGCPLTPPQSNIKPTIIKNTIMTTLIIANQYSDSPA